MAITEKELDALHQRELTEDELTDLVIFEMADYSNHEELVLNYKKLVKHASFYYSYRKKTDIRNTNKNMRIEELEALLEEKNTNSTMEAVENTEELDIEDREPFFADYLREGKKVQMTEGSIATVDKEGNKVLIAKTDGNEWRDNPPTRVHEVTGKNLIVSVTDEYEDGTSTEIKKYTIAT